MANQKYNMFQKRKTSSKPANSEETPSQTDTINPQLQWDAYKAMEKQVHNAWLKLQNDVKKQASPRVLMEDKNHLMLLLAECNYMARECIRWIDLLPETKKKKSKKASKKKL